MRWRLVRRGLLLYVVRPRCSTSSGRARSCRTTARCSCVAALLFTLRSRWVISVGALSALAGWLIHWWVYERELDGHDTSWLTSPGGAHAARAAVRRVRERHPPAAAVARVPLRRHRARARARAAVVATGRRRSGLHPVRGRHVGRRLGHDRPRPRAARATIRSTAVSPTRPARSAPPCSRSPRSRGSPTGSPRRRWSTPSGAPARCRSRSTSPTRWCSTCSPRTTGSTWCSRAASPRRSSLAASYWLLATAAAVAYHRRFGRGPVERLYRALTA